MSKRSLWISLEEKIVGNQGGIVNDYLLSLSLSLRGNSNSVMALNRSTPLGKGLGGTEWELFATISPRNLLPIWLIRHVPSCVFSRARPMIRWKPAEYVCRETTWEVGIFYFTGNRMVKRASRNKHSGDSTVSFYWQVFLNLWGIKSPCGYF